MRITFVYPSTFQDEHTIPYGLLHVASAIGEGHDVKIFDSRHESYDNLDFKNTDVLGITAMTGSQIRWGLWISQKAKLANPSIKIVWGGAHVTSLPIQSLETSNGLIDCIIAGEGETGINEFLKDTEINLIESNRREYYPLKWELLNFNRYIHTIRGHPAVNYIASRGCNFSCTFCNVAATGKFVPRPIEQVKADFDFFKSKGIGYILLHDDNLFLNRKSIRDVAEQMKAHGFKWSANGHPALMNPELIKTLAEKGLVEVRLSCESADERILKEVVHKNLTLCMFEKTVRTLIENGITPCTSFMFGYPSETLQERRRTMDYMLYMHEKYPELVFFPYWVYTPYPGTKMLEMARQYGFEEPQTLEEWSDYTWDKANVPWLDKDAEMIHYSSRWAFNEVELLPVKMLQWLSMFRFRHDFWKLGLEKGVL